MAEPAESSNPDISGHNPFQLLAFLLFKVRHSLEDVEEPGRDPRWIRISRARQSSGGGADAIGTIVKGGIDGFSEAISYMLELTLDIRELLVQTDAGKALVETTADLVIAATSEEFQNGVRALVGQPPGNDALGGVSGFVEDMKGYLDYIPEPEDVEGLGHELYRMLCIEQIASPLADDGSVDEAELPATTSDHIEVAPTGKIRLMQWAFSHNTSTFGLGTKDSPESDKAELYRLGVRRIWKPSAADKLPTSSIIKHDKNGQEEILVDQFFDEREPMEANRTLDIEELHTMLEKMGYNEPAITTDQRKVFSDNTVKLLRKFQIINGLSITGQLDNDTLNRLMHLDFENKNIRRAKPYDPSRLNGMDEDLSIKDGVLKLVNPDANHWGDEGLSLRNDMPGYAFYRAGKTLPPPTGETVSLKEKGGWIHDTDNGAIEGFVALQSRIVRPGSTDFSQIFHGGRFSEGEAESPFMFFCARHTEPWREARNGQPGSDSLFGSAQPVRHSISRLYQWANISGITVPSGYEMVIHARVSIRSLWSDKNNPGGMSDQGRIFIELYKNTVFKAATGLATPRDPEKLVDKDKSAENGTFKGTDRAHSAWLPETSVVVDEQNMEAEIRRKRNWTPCKTPELVVPTGTVAVVVGLEGRHQSAYDTDAYFDNVKLSYSIRKKEA